VLSAPLTRWMMHSERSPIPVHLRKPDVAEAAWKQCTFICPTVANLVALTSSLLDSVLHSVH
jgi:hypothetical protein